MLIRIALAVDAGAALDRWTLDLASPHGTLVWELARVPALLVRLDRILRSVTRRVPRFTLRSLSAAGVMETRPLEMSPPATVDAPAAQDVRPARMTLTEDTSP